MGRLETEQALDRFQAIVEGVEAPIVRHWQPGSSLEEVQAELAGFDSVAAHPDLVTWFGWHDGTDLPQQYGWGVDYTAGQRLFGLWHLLGSVDAVGLHERLYSEAREDGFPEFYPDGWFPVLQYVGGGVLCVDTEEGGLYIHDAHADLPDNPPVLQFENIAEMVETFIDLVESGVATWDHAAQRFVTDVARLPKKFRARPAYW